uniref:Ubiquitin carboxyl-terminal hydrolase MINDY n=1 Tax=Sphenodon punctatus TaxID=8508 RepID=A0A8D0G8E5_SPHPU
MDNFYVEEVAASLVREFLNKKGLKKTSAEMDQEFPRTALSINNRNELRKTLHLQSLYKQNKVKRTTCTMVFLTDLLFYLYIIVKPTNNLTLSPYYGKLLSMVFLFYRSILNTCFCHYSYCIDEQINQILPLETHHKESEKYKTGTMSNSSPSSSRERKFPNNCEDSKTIESLLEMKTREKLRSRSGLIVRGMMAGPTASSHEEIKTVLFGSGLCCFSDEWKMQSFTFNDMPPLKYGIVQKKGGPCGVLAAVQACVLQHLIFGDSNRNGETRCLHPSEAHRTKCLALAIATILWRAGSHKEAVVALYVRGFISIIEYRLFLHVHTDDLLFCYKQELVNLLLTGKAASNVFNDVIELDSGNGNITILKGISSRSDIGLLSLFEHYDVCQVGCYLKTPNHFSVLFCLRKDLLGDWRTERRFDLYYYDGLANQQEEIRLTVDTTQSYIEDREDGLIPPIEHCIRTK